MDTPEFLSLSEKSSMSNSDRHGDRLRVLELYSGIGGMRYALEAAGIPFQIVLAVDMNPVVNQIYRHNFGSEGHCQRNLNSFTAKEIENLKIDIMTMSPPCQPFTRVGLKKDIGDARSDSFLHILTVLTQLKKKPMFIVLENVQGFEKSEARNILIQTMVHCCYKYQEYLLSPQDLGVPNSRLRYYMIAKLESLPCLRPCEMICNTIPSSNFSWHSRCSKCQHEVNKQVKTACPLKHFLEENDAEYFKANLVPDHILLKYWTVFDIVDENSNMCCCFTKAYSHYAQGTGSIFVPINDPPKVSEVFEQVSCTENIQEKLELLRSLKLRYFTPKEIANIMCFPDSFDFPASITLKQKYRSLGNSLNVFVVACLMHSLFGESIFSRTIS